MDSANWDEAQFKREAEESERLVEQYKKKLENDNAKHAIKCARHSTFEVWGQYFGSNSMFKLHDFQNYAQIVDYFKSLDKMYRDVGGKSGKFEKLHIVEVGVKTITNNVASED